MSTHFIETHDLCYSYDDSDKLLTEKQFAVRNVSVTVEKGEFVAVIGRNGSGKSTFAKLLNLVLEPSSGELLIDGKKITPDISDEEILDLRRRVGMVFQNPDNQLVATVVEEDVAFGPENLGLPPEEIRKRVDDSLRLVGMSAYASAEPSRLSGGQKQRVAIAGIIAMRPECMIFDESTAMLDPIGRAEVVSVMERLSREEGLTVINITHLMDEAARADKVIVINKGEVLGCGMPKDIFADEDLMRRAGLELPQCAALLWKLKERGIDIDVSGITPEECAGIILNKLAEDR